MLAGRRPGRRMLSSRSSGSWRAPYHRASTSDDGGHGDGLGDECVHAKLAARMPQVLGPLLSCALSARRHWPLARPAHATAPPGPGNFSDLDIRENEKEGGAHLHKTAHTATLCCQRERRSHLTQMAAPPGPRRLAQSALKSGPPSRRPPSPFSVACGSNFCPLLHWQMVPRAACGGRGGAATGGQLAQP